METSRQHVNALGPQQDEFDIEAALLVRFRNVGAQLWFNFTRKSIDSVIALSAVNFKPANPLTSQPNKPINRRQSHCPVAAFIFSQSENRNSSSRACRYVFVDKLELNFTRNVLIKK